MTAEPVLLQGGQIWPGTGTSPFTGSVLMSGDQLVAVGKDEDVSNHPHAGKARKLDIKGKAVLPAFTDSHIHLQTYARQSYGVDLSGCTSMVEVLQEISQYSKDKAPDDWIYGYNFNENNWDKKEMPTRSDLDSLGIPNPVLLLRICLHLYVANSRAIGVAGEESLASNEMAGRGPEGNLNGIFPESSGLPLVRAFEEFLSGCSGFGETLANVYEELLGFGISEIHTIGAASLGLNENFDLYCDLRSRGRLPVRTVVYLDEFPSEKVACHQGDDWLKYGGLKIFLDGSLGPRTAALTSPYSDSNTRGVLIHTEEDLRAVYEKAENDNLQIQSHAIGDQAIDRLLDVLEWTESKPSKRRTYPHKISHIQICRPDQIERVSKLNVVCDVQPNSIASDARMSVPRLGEERLNWAFPFRSLMGKGLTLLGSSDCPVEPISPFLALRAAVTRKDLSGFPGSGWNASERLTLEQALSLYTCNPPKAVGKEGRKGLLAPGFLADIVVLDRDIFHVEAESYPEIRVLYTIVGGEIAFQGE